MKIWPINEINEINEMNMNTFSMMAMHQALFYGGGVYVGHPGSEIFLR